MIEPEVQPVVSPDEVATTILAKDPDGEGAVKFEGWVAAPDADTVRLYTSPPFLEYLEIAKADVMVQVKATLERPAGGSTIWVKRGAPVKRVQVGKAEHFEELVLGASSDDPAAARWPPRR